MTAPASAGQRPQHSFLPLLVAGAFFMENLDATVIAPALPVMAHSFGVRPVDMGVGVSAYLLTLGMFIPVSGWIAERFGARRVFASAIALFTLASLFCGLSNSLPMFVAMRVLQGVAGALMVPVGRLVVLRTTPKERLISVMATLIWPAMAAPVLGPPLGGLIVEHWDWRWIFFLNLPLGLLAFLLALKLVPPGGEIIRRKFDWPGFLLVTGSLFCLGFFAETLTQREFNPLHAGLALALGLGLATLGLRHLKSAENPLLSLEVLHVRTFAVTIFGSSFFRIGVGAIPLLAPAMLQIGFGYGSFEAGVMLMAVFAGNLAMKPTVGPILRGLGFRKVLVVNTVVHAVLLGAIAVSSANMSMWLIAALLFLNGLSRSLQFSAISMMAFADVPVKHMASANTMFLAVTQLTIGLGVSAGAIAWRFGEILAVGQDPATPFRIAFVLIGIVCLGGLFDSLRLKPDAGNNVTQKASAV